MRPKLNRLFCFLIIFLTGCASLTKSQLSEVNAFGQTTRNFSDFPGGLTNALNRVILQDAAIRANAEITAEKHVVGLQDANQFKQQSKLITDTLDITFQIIDRLLLQPVYFKTTSYGRPGPSTN